MQEIEEKKEMGIREQIEWYLDRIDNEKDLSKILTYINRVLVGGRT